MKITREENIVSCLDGSFEIEDDQTSMLSYFHPLNDIREGCKIKKDGYIYYKDGSRKKVFVESREAKLKNLWPGNLNFKKLVPLYEKLKDRNNKYIKISSEILKKIWENGGKAHSFNRGKYFLFELSEHGGSLWNSKRDLKKKPEKLLNLELGNTLVFYRSFISSYKELLILKLIENLVTDNLPLPTDYKAFDYLLVKVGSIEFLYLLIDSGGYKYWEFRNSDIKIYRHIMR